MKLLVLTSRFPYPVEKGDKLRIYHQLVQLAQRHEIVLFSLSDQPVAEADYRQVAALCSSIYLFSLPRPGIFLHVALGLLRGEAIQMAYFFRRKIAHRLAQIIETEQPDMLYCQLIRMAAYVQALRPAIPCTIDYMDCFSAGMKRQATREQLLRRGIYRRESRLLARYEREVYGAFAHHCIISEQDRRLLDLPADQQDRVQVVPNGVDTAYFCPDPAQTPTHDVVFAGNMGYFPNVEAACFLASEVMPLVWATYPQATLLIAGARPTPAVRRLAADPRIDVSGWVADIRRAYGGGRVCVAPLRTGSGQQNKVLEAMSMARPCVTTSLVNNAIGAVPAEAMLLGDTPAQLAQQICAVLADPALGARLGTRARVFVEERYSWPASVALLEACWQRP
ncbi:MAG: TIGR03087 family PEP-CTERM/XrtA system glycosyltransferase [Bacteroidia bacterium]